ncbi:phage holin family protein [Georgenia faecalis]|uniref:Phage holin family protein n=1 Tax=Georgenia faecalis TaxID=2483799 RepID=A0ABV9D8F8_9MICO|nr:phage holin family protein [Georgenia faecalis]
MGFLIQLVLNGIALWLCAWLLDGVSITQAATAGEQVVVVLVVSFIFTVVNAVIKPVVKFFSLPLTILTFGLFTLVINALMILLTSWITGLIGWGLHVDGFWWAVGAGLVISIITWVLSALVPADH